MDAIKNIELRLQKYKDTGNTEFLVDIANFAMLEFMHPSIPGAKFIPMLVRAVYGEVVFLRNKERDPLLHLFNVAPAVLGLFSYWTMCIITTRVAYSCLLVSFGLFLALVPVVMATIILIGVIL